MNRRHFLSTSAKSLTFLPLLGCAGSFPKSRTGYLLRNAMVFDGTGKPPIILDLRTSGDRIIELGNNLPSADSFSINADNLTVAPGFIDIHSHTDLSLFVNPNAESKLRQGVTTEVVGQDGSSVGPWTDERFENRKEFYRDRYGASIEFQTLPGFLDAIDQLQPAVNVASMIGTGTLRAFAVGNNDVPATPAQLEEMVALVEEALAAGGCGVSSGLEYIPDAFSSTAELIELCKPLARKQLPYATHMRNEDDSVLGALEEALHIGRMAQIPVQVSHLKAQGQRNWWKADQMLEIIDRANENGQDVTFDRYPYTAYSTGLASLFPQWARAGDTDTFLERLANDDGRIRNEVEQKIEKLGDWDSVQISGVYNESLQWALGKRLGALATTRDQDPYELLLLLTREDRNRTDIVGFGMSEENTSKFLSHPRGMICSDGGARATYGPLSEDSPHPRTFGAFPRVLGRYVRDEGLLPLSDAIHKMTGAPAQKLKLADRGRIAAGMAADIVVFDAQEINDNATFDKPHQYSSGIKFVFVNGQLALDDGGPVQARAGKALRV